MANDLERNCYYTSCKSVSNEKASLTPHTYRCTLWTCLSHKMALKHSASSTTRQRYHTDTWLPQWPAIQTRPAGERERERDRNPQESHSKQHQSRQGVTRWRKPFQEAKPRHSRHQTASDKKPCPPNGVRKRRPSRKCLHLYMQLLEALSENATAKRSFRRLRVEAHDNWAMRLAAAKTHNATLLWKHIEQSPLPSPSSLSLLFCSCFCTAEPPTDVDCEPNTWSVGWQGCAKDTNARHLFQRCHPYNSSKKPIFAGTLRCFPVAANVASKCCRKQSSATLD